MRICGAEKSGPGLQRGLPHRCPLSARWRSGICAAAKPAKGPVGPGQTLKTMLDAAAPLVRFAAVPLSTLPEGFQTESARRVQLLLLRSAAIVSSSRQDFLETLKRGYRHWNAVFRFCRVHTVTVGLAAPSLCAVAGRAAELAPADAGGAHVSRAGALVLHAGAPGRACGLCNCPKGSE